jgi:hypothetical protein
MPLLIDLENICVHYHKVLVLGEDLDFLRESAHRDEFLQILQVWHESIDHALALTLVE